MNYNFSKFGIQFVNTQANFLKTGFVLMDYGK